MPVIIQGNELLVYDMSAHLEGGEMVCQYRLRRKVDFEVGKGENENMIGASVFGTVTEVKGDLVKVSLECDDDQSGGTGIWFPFATVYSSPEGSCWYFMPEEGSRVRLCLPGTDEGERIDVKSEEGILREKLNNVILR